MFTRHGFQGEISQNVFTSNLILFHCFSSPVDALDGQVENKEALVIQARQEPVYLESQLPEPELKNSSRPVTHRSQPCHQTDSIRSVCGQSSSFRHEVVSDQPLIGQSVTGQSITRQCQSVPGHSIPGQSGTSNSAIGQSSVSHDDDIMWDDDSYFDDVALLEQLSQAEAMEISKSQNDCMSDKARSPPDLFSDDLTRNLPNDSSKLFTRPRRFGEGNQACTESNVKTGQQSSQPFFGSVTRPTRPGSNTDINQECNALSAVRDAPQIQRIVQVQREKLATVKPTPPTQATISKLPSVQPVQCVPNVTIQNQAQVGSVPETSLPIDRDVNGRRDTKAVNAKSWTSSRPQLGPSTNVRGTCSSRNAQEAFITPAAASTPIANKIHGASSVLTQKDSDSSDLFESSLTDEMMLSLCSGMDSPQASKPTGHTSMVQDSKPAVVTMCTAVPSVNIPHKTPGWQMSNKINLSSKPEMITKSHTASASGNRYTFRRPVKDVSDTVTQAKSSLGMTSSNAPSVGHTFMRSKMDVVHPASVTSAQPAGTNARFQPVRVSSATHQLPQSSRSAVLSRTARSSVPGSASKPSSGLPVNRDRATSSLYNKPVNVSTTSNDIGKAHSTGSFQNMAVESSTGSKLVELSTLTGRLNTTLYYKHTVSRSLA